MISRTELLKSIYTFFCSLRSSIGEEAWRIFFCCCEWVGGEGGVGGELYEASPVNIKRTQQKFLVYWADRGKFVYNKKQLSGGRMNFNAGALERV